MTLSATRTFDYVMVGLTGLLVAGGHLLVWADDPDRGFVTGNQLFSIWALPLYAGFAVAAYMVFIWWGGRRGRKRLPAAYRFALAGAGLFVAALVLEFAWRSVGGRPESGPEGVLSPTRIALFVGTAMLISGPLLSISARLGASDGRADATYSRASRDAAALGVAIGLLLSLATLVTGFMSPFVVLAGGNLRESQVEVPTDLYVIPLDGSGGRRLTTTPSEWEAHPDVAPAGDRIAYARGVPDDFRLYSVSADGTNSVRATDSNVHEDGPAYAPDGFRITYWAPLPARSGPTPITVSPAPAPGPSDLPAEPIDQEGLAIWMLDGRGAAPTPVRNVAGEGIEEWSPDGRMMCGWTVANGTFDVAVWRADDAAVTVLTDDAGSEWGCTWSPDGTRLAFHSDRDGDFEIYSVAVDGSDLRQLTDEPGIDQWPRWTSVGDRLAFISSRGGELDIYVSPSDMSSPINVTNDPALEDGFLGLDWLPDGSAIVAASMGRGYAGSDPNAAVPLGVGALLVQSLLVAAALLFAWRLAGSLLGVPTIALTVAGVLAALVGKEPLFLVAFVAAGVAADGYVAVGRDQPARRRAIGAVGLATGVLLATYFVVLGVTRGIGWALDLVMGTAILGVLLSVALALVVTWPSRTPETLRSPDP